MMWFYILIMIIKLTASRESNISVLFHMVTPEETKSSTDNVTLVCEVTDITKDSSFKVIGYTILINQSNQWNTLAQISQTGGVQVKGGSVLDAKGSIGNAGAPDSSLHLTFLLRDLDVSGDYRCDVTYNHVDSKEVSREVSKTLSSKDILRQLNEYTVIESNSTYIHSAIQDNPDNVPSMENNENCCRCVAKLEDKYKQLGDFIKEMFRSFDTSVNKIIKETKSNSDLMKSLAINASRNEDNLNRVLNMLENSTTDIISLSRIINSELVRNLSEEQSVLGSTKSLEKRLKEQESLIDAISQQWKTSFNGTILEDVTDDPKNVVWPNGTYAMFKTNTGCPTVSEKTWFWKEGFRRFHTEASYNADNHSVDIHLALPIKSKESGYNFFYLSYCAKDTDYGRGSFWPKGSYCINKVGRTCPLGFKSGGFKIDEESGSYAGMSVGFPLQTGAPFFLKFCCRDDGNPRFPIFLPRYTPFYLSRFGGICQAVFGMRTWEEFISLDTDDGNNEDASFYPHPDGYAKNGFKMHLCYYQPV